MSEYRSALPPGCEGILLCVARISSPGGAWRDLDVNVCALAAQFLSQLPCRSEVVYCTSYAALLEAASSRNRRTIIISNFPANTTNMSGSGIILPQTFIEGDLQYSTSLRFFGELLSSRPDLILHVITGASTLSLPDYRIRCLSLQSRITVARTFAIANEGEFRRRYLRYVSQILFDSVHSIAPHGDPLATDGRCSPSMTSFLIVCQQRHGFAVPLAEQMVIAGLSPPPTCVFAQSPEETYRCLVHQYFDVVLVLDIPGQWLGVIPSLAWPRPTTAVCVVTSANTTGPFPGNVTLYHLRPYHPEHIGHLLEFLGTAIGRSLADASKRIETLFVRINGTASETTLRDHRRLLLKEYRIEDYWVNLGKRLREIGHLNAAQEVYCAALEFHVDSVRIWTSYSILLLEWGRMGAALYACERALAIKPSDSLALSTRGRLAELLHRHGEAIHFYGLAMLRRPDDPLLWNNAGTCYLGLGKEDTAVAMFLEAVRIDPGYTNALFNLAAIYAKRQEVARAAPFIKGLRAITPDDREVQQLEQALSDGDRKEVSLPRARRLAHDWDSDFGSLHTRASGDPRSLFLSYAWPSQENQAFARRLATDLRDSGFAVVFDREMNMDIGRLLLMLLACQNVVVLNDQHYVESCLLGRIPVSHRTCMYPSYAIPLGTDPSFASNLLAVAAEVEAVVKKVAETQGREAAAERGYAEAVHRLPGVRVFAEGWRLDEIQLVYHNITRYKSLSIAYRDGSHCLSGYPLFDFSHPSCYRESLKALTQVLTMWQERALSDGPFRQELSQGGWGRDRKGPRLCRPQLWRVAETDVVVIRPDVAPTGGVSHLIQRFRDWEPAADYRAKR